MKVKELIKKLKTCNQEAEVVMSSDSEGNSYSPFYDYYEGIYIPDSTWSGEVRVGRKLTKDLKNQGYSEEDCYDGEDGLDAVILCPTN